MAQRLDLVTRIRAALEADARIDARRHPIRVMDLGDGIALEGEVGNIAAKRIALRVAEEIAGLTPVTDSLRVRVEAGEDKALGALFGRALLATRDLRSCAIRLEENGRTETLYLPAASEQTGEISFCATDEGVVFLKGRVGSPTMRRVVDRLAWRTPGCREVINRLHVPPAREYNDEELSKAVRLALEMTPPLRADHVRISTIDRVVTLSGVLTRDESRRLAEFDVWAIPGVRGVRNRIDVVP